MTKLRPVSIASLMMLVWLAFYVLAAFFATRWADFLAIIGCTVPMLASKRFRGDTFGAVFCNTVKYKKKEYALCFAFTISGCALISAICYLLFAGGTAEAGAARGDFLYLLVFYCFIPAFFEEWFVRGGVLGALAPYKAGGVWLCAIFFMLMHTDLTKYLYAFFAGFLITALVYLTECIYLGMLLHFINNFTSLLLSYLPKGNHEYAALGVIAVIFVTSLALLKRSKLFSDVKDIFMQGKNIDKENLSPLFWVFVTLSIGVTVFRFI